MNRTTASYHVMMLEHDGRIRLVGRRAIQVIGGTWEPPEGDDQHTPDEADDHEHDERDDPASPG
jgi:hypothetical protein